jgi:hypothetical protein
MCSAFYNATSSAPAAFVVGRAVALAIFVSARLIIMNKLSLTRSAPRQTQLCSNGRSERGTSSQGVVASRSDLVRDFRCVYLCTDASII